MRRRAVITGIGVVTPLGNSLESLGEALRQGRSAVGPLRSFDASEMPARIGAEILDFDPRAYVDKKERKRLNQMVRTMHLAVAAAQLAMTDARGTFEPTRLGVVFGSSSLPGDLAEMGEASLVSARDDRPGMDLKRWGEVGIPNVPPTWMLTHIPNMTASHVSILHNAQGPNNTISQSDVGGLLALGEAFRMIQNGRADAVLVGGADTKVAPINMIRFTLGNRLSRRNDDPEGACRPFDRDRDGEVFGEGAAVFVLEDRERALARGATIHGEVVGFASGIDPLLKGTDLGRILASAISDARLVPPQIDHINAHGCSTKLDDRWEAAGIAEGFGGKPKPVVGLKGYFGNLGAGGGLVELAAGIAAARQGQVLPTRNFQSADGDCPIEVVRQQRAFQTPHFVKISLTDLGQCAAAVIRVGEER